MWSTLCFQTQAAFWCLKLSPRLNTAFKKKASGAEGKTKTTTFALKIVLLRGSPTLANQKAFWEKLLGSLGSENRPVHLKARAKKSLCVLNVDYQLV